MLCEHSVLELSTFTTCTWTQQSYRDKGWTWKFSLCICELLIIRISHSWDIWGMVNACEMWMCVLLVDGMRYIHAIINLSVKLQSRKGVIPKNRFFSLCRVGWLECMCVCELRAFNWICGFNIPSNNIYNNLRQYWGNQNLLKYSIQNWEKNESEMFVCNWINNNDVRYVTTINKTRFYHLHSSLYQSKSSLHMLVTHHEQ